MNILFISKYTVTPNYGSPSRQYFLSKHLSRINDNKVMLIGSRSSLCDIPEFKGLSKEEQEDGIETIILNGPKITPGFSIRRILSWVIFEKNIFLFRKRIKNFRPDIIIVSSLSILTFLSGFFLKKWLKKPLVIEIRDIYPLTLQEIGEYSSLNPFILLLKWIEKIGYKNADLIVSTLPNAKEHVFAVLKRPFDFYWLPMGIDPDFFNPDENSNQILIKRNCNDFIVAYAGTLGKANALDIIFQAAEVLEDEYSNIRFFFIGNGPLKSYYQKKYKKLKNINFIPAVSKKDLPNVLKQTDILINTWLDKPIYKFGISPNKWMDYMYAAKPILVAFSGFRSIIDEADCGKFIPAEDRDSLVKSIIQFSQIEPERLKIIGENGRRYLLKNLSYETLAADLNKKLILIEDAK